MRATPVAHASCVQTENILDLEPEMLGRNTLNLGASSGEHYQDASYLDDADVYSEYVARTRVELALVPTLTRAPAQ